jgi:hypothetical protein
MIWSSEVRISMRLGTRCRLVAKKLLVVGRRFHDLRNPEILSHLAS